MVNVVKLEGMGKLGEEQLEWLKRDLEPLKASQPIVIFAHIPLWAIYPDWGWATEDSVQAMALLRADWLRALLVTVGLVVAMQRRDAVLAPGAVDLTRAGIDRIAEP